MFFQNVHEAPSDPIFGVASTCKADLRPHKVDLLVGIFKDEQLKAELMPSVRKAKEEIFSTDLSADYLPLDGLQEMVEALEKVLFGEKLYHEESGRIYGAHAVGGTGALRIGADFLAREVSKIVFIPQPTWTNHNLIFERAGFQIEPYSYYSKKIQGFDLNGTLGAMEQMPKKSIVLLHACCHNPTGCDPTEAEWALIAERMKELELFPFFDCAYQGFGNGLEQDAKAVRIFTQQGLECLIAYSCSKSFSLYCQRVGALFVVSESSSAKVRIASQIKRIIRANYSNPPAHGAKIVAHILKGSLRKKWEEDLLLMRERIQSTRKEFIKRLSARIKDRDFTHLLQNNGMFSLIDLEKFQGERLIEQYAVYLHNGRVSLSGLNRANLDYVVESLAAVMERG